MYIICKYLLDNVRVKYYFRFTEVYIKLLYLVMEVSMEKFRIDFIHFNEPDVIVTSLTALGASSGTSNMEYYGSILPIGISQKENSKFLYYTINYNDSISADGIGRHSDTLIPWPILETTYLEGTPVYDSATEKYDVDALYGISTDTYYDIFNDGNENYYFTVSTRH